MFLKKKKKKKRILENIVDGFFTIYFKEYLSEKNVEVDLNELYDALNNPHMLFVEHANKKYNLNLSDPEKERLIKREYRSLKNILRYKKLSENKKYKNRKEKRLAKQWGKQSIKINYYLAGKIFYDLFSRYSVFQKKLNDYYSLKEEIQKQNPFLDRIKNDFDNKFVKSITSTNLLEEARKYILLDFDVENSELILKDLYSTNNVNLDSKNFKVKWSYEKSNDKIKKKREFLLEPDLKANMTDLFYLKKQKYTLKENFKILFPDFEEKNKGNYRHRKSYLKKIKNLEKHINDIEELIKDGKRFVKVHNFIIKQQLHDIYHYLTNLKNIAKKGAQYLDNQNKHHIKNDDKIEYMDYLFKNYDYYLNEIKETQNEFNDIFSAYRNHFTKNQKKRIIKIEKLSEITEKIGLPNKIYQTLKDLALNNKVNLDKIVNTEIIKKIIPDDQRLIKTLSYPDEFKDSFKAENISEFQKYSSYITLTLVKKSFVEEIEKNGLKYLSYGFENLEALNNKYKKITEFQKKIFNIIPDKLRKYKDQNEILDYKFSSKYNIILKKDQNFLKNNKDL